MGRLHFLDIQKILLGFPGGSVVNNLPASRRCGLDAWVGKSPWRKKWQPTQICLTGEFHGQKSLSGYGPWNCKRFGHDLVTK